MDRRDRLRRRSGACGKILSGHPAILAGAAGRRADAQLFGNSTQDRAAGSGRAGFPDPGTTASWRRRADQFVRDRVARTDIIAGDRRLCRRTGRDVSTWATWRHPRVSAIALIAGGASHFGEPRRVTGGGGASFAGPKPAGA